jgi:hypothetical protein
MTYQAGGLIQAIDYNTLIGTQATTNPNLNEIFATGIRDLGYGQPALTPVNQNVLIESENWANLINKINTIASHQGVSLVTPLTPPADNNVITYLSAVTTGLTQIENNRHYALAQGITETTTTRFTTSNWNDKITFTFICTFESGDKARYFFNAGGQIVLNFTHAATTSKADVLFNSLASSIGTLVLSAPTETATAEIAGTEYNGFTRIGGTGTPQILNTSIGYYSLSTSDRQLFRMYPTITGVVSDIGFYSGTNISVFAKTNGTQGTNGDIGSTLTVTCVWDQDPNSFSIAAGNNTGPVNNSTTTLVVRYPRSIASGGVLTNTWGSVNVQSSVVGN